MGLIDDFLTSQMINEVQQVPLFPYTHIYLRVTSLTTDTPPFIYNAIFNARTSINSLNSTLEKHRKPLTELRTEQNKRFKSQHIL